MTDSESEEKILSPRLEHIDATRFESENEDEDDSSGFPTEEMNSCGRTIEPMRSILRCPSTSRIRRRTTIRQDLDFRWLWKAISLLVIPLALYYLYQLYPSQMWIHLASCCGLYGILDLLEHDPFSFPKPMVLDEEVKSFLSPLQFRITPLGDGVSENEKLGFRQTLHERQRKVQFAESTKFYRLPKPMSRRQKAAFCNKRTDKSRKSAETKQEKTQYSPPPANYIPERPSSSSQSSYQLGTSQSLSDTARDSERTSTQEHAGAIDWKEASARLRCAVRSSSSPGSPTRDDAAHLGSTTQCPNQENILPAAQERTHTDARASFAEKQELIGGDSAILRLRLAAAKPLKAANR